MNSEDANVLEALSEIDEPGKYNSNRILIPGLSVMYHDFDSAVSYLIQNKTKETDELKKVIYSLKLDLTRGRKNIVNPAKGRSLETCLNLYRATRLS